MAISDLDCKTAICNGARSPGSAGWLSDRSWGFCTLEMTFRKFICFASLSGLMQSHGGDSKAQSPVKWFLTLLFSLETHFRPKTLLRRWSITASQMLLSCQSNRQRQKDVSVSGSCLGIHQSWQCRAAQLPIPEPCWVFQCPPQPLLIKETLDEICWKSSAESVAGRRKGKSTPAAWGRPFWLPFAEVGCSPISSHPRVLALLQQGCSGFFSVSDDFLYLLLPWQSLFPYSRTNLSEVSFLCVRKRKQTHMNVCP